jgi:hypothetical protein
MNELRIYNQLVAGDAQGIPPVEKWNPPVTGDIDIRIAADGTWYHEGTAIRRAALMNLFASVLWREDDQYYLVTPVEKVRIQVEDAPLLVTQVEYTGDVESQTIVFATLTGDRFALDAEHPLRVEYSEAQEPRPYVRVRRNLDALIHRNVFYSLVEHAHESPGDQCTRLSVRSRGIDIFLGEFN